LDEALLGAAADSNGGTPVGIMPGTLSSAEQSPQEQALATFLSLTRASQTRLNTEAFYGVPASLRETQGIVDTLVNSMSASVTRYAAMAEDLSNNEVLDLLRP